LKVLNVNAVLDPVTGGGTAERTVQISRALIQAGTDCSIMTTDLGLTEKVLSNLEDIDLIAFKCLIKRFYIPFVSYFRIKRLVREFDIVHIMGHWTVLNALVYIAARSLGKPYVVCPAGALPIFGRSKIIKKIYNKLIGKKIIQNADAWIAITDDEKPQFLPYKIDEASIVVIPNGINPEDFPNGGDNNFRKEIAVNSAPFMLFLGRLNPIKGPDLLLEAFIRGKDKWPEWHLVYAGPDGGLLDGLRKTATKNNLINRVHFIGYVGGDKKSAAYHAADCLVIPSLQEAMSIVVLESGISGTPVVLTDQCGFDQVEHVGGGKVCSATADGIYNSLQEIVDNNESRVHMGEKLKEYVENNYTWAVVIGKYVDLYNRLVD